MQDKDYHNTKAVPASTNVKDSLSTDVQQIIDNAVGKVIFETAPDNNLKMDGIIKGDGIMIDTGLNEPHSGGSMYLIRFSDGYKKLCRLSLLPDDQYFIGTDLTKENTTLSGVEVVGQLIGKVAVRKL